MSIVYRAHSPSRGEFTTVTDDPQYAAGVASTRNQHTHTTGHTADWTVQQGTVQWELP